MRRPPSPAPDAAPGAAKRAAKAIGGASLLLVAACQSHSAAWNDAWAQCEAHAIEQMEFASPDSDQRTTWRERYIGACMQAQGFSDPQYLIR
jgi:hypothetical protein